MRRPTTSSHYTRSGTTASIRSGTAASVSLRTTVTTSSGTGAARPFTARGGGGSISIRPGNQAANIPSDFKDFKRPVTAAAGLGNVHKSNSKAFQNRQIQDAAYYFSLLNTKEREIIHEMDKIKHDIEQLKAKNHSRSSSSLSVSSGQKKIEIVHDELVKGVRELEGLLADHNVAKEKLRQGFDVEDIETHIVELRMRNEKEANDLDEIFLFKRKCDDEVNRLTKDIELAHGTIKKRLQQNKTDPTLFDKYQKYQKQIQEIGVEGRAMEEEIKALRHEHANLLSIVQGSKEYQIRKQYLSQKKKVNDLKNKLVQIDEDLLVAEMDYQEAHSYLLEKAKKAQSRTKELTKEENDIMKKIKSIEEDQLQRLNTSNNNNVYEGTNNHVVVPTNADNEKDIDETIIKSKAALKTIMNEIEDKRAEVSSLMERINRSTIISTNTKPTESALKELNIDKDVKEKHLANSKQTVTRLIDQKEKRMKELEMVENLEVKITTENKELIEKIDMMRKETHVYADLNRLEESDELTRLYLTQMRERYIQRCDFMRSKVKQISSDYEKNQSILKKSDVWKSLLDLEEKLRRQGQVVFSLQQTVKEKERKTNYEASKRKCLELAHELLLEQ